ncbi:MAG: glutaredoxin family protein [Pseudomonadales bacterium]
MKHFTLMSTDHCHLCEQAEAMLVQLLDPTQHSVEVADIAHDDLLLARYGVRIPVLVNEKSHAELNWPFDMPALADFLAK